MLQQTYSVVEKAIELAYHVVNATKSAAAFAEKAAESAEAAAESIPSTAAAEASRAAAMMNKNDAAHAKEAAIAACAQVMNIRDNLDITIITRMMPMLSEDANSGAVAVRAYLSAGADAANAVLDEAMRGLR